MPYKQRPDTITTKWLYQKFIIEKLNIKQIAKICQISYLVARRWLIDSGFQVKTRKRSVIPQELKNYDWLYQHYISKEMSLVEIADLLKIRHLLVARYLKKNNIPIRTKRAGNRLKRQKNGIIDYFVMNHSVITGCLLGDGCLRCNKPEDNESCASFSTGHVFKDHTLYVAQQLFSKNAEERIRFLKPVAHKADSSIKIKVSNGLYLFRTLSHVELLSYYREWYPSSNNYKKVIPKSISLDNTAMLHWFMDDGYSYIANRVGRKPQLRIYFATQGFTGEDLTMLSKIIKEKFGLLVYPRYHQRHGKIKGTGYEMELSTAKEQVELFYSIIGPCPVPSLEYKWKL